MEQVYLMTTDVLLPCPCPCMAELHRVVNTWLLTARAALLSCAVTHHKVFSQYSQNVDNLFHRSP